MRENPNRNEWNVQIINRPFLLEMLDELQFDCIMMDCEGCENALLNYDKTRPPSTTEEHGSEFLTQVMDTFCAGYLANVSNDPSVSLVDVGLDSLRKAHAT